MPIETPTSGGRLKPKAERLRNRIPNRQKVVRSNDAGAPAETARPPQVTQSANHGPQSADPNAPTLYGRGIRSYLSGRTRRDQRAGRTDDDIKAMLTAKTGKSFNDLVLKEYGPVPPDKVDPLELEARMIEKGEIRPVYSETEDRSRPPRKTVIDEVSVPHPYMAGRRVTETRVGPEDQVDAAKEQGLQDARDEFLGGMAAGLAGMRSATPSRRNAPASPDKPPTAGLPRTAPRSGVDPNPKAPRRGVRPRDRSAGDKPANDNMVPRPGGVPAAGKADQRGPANDNHVPPSTGALSPQPTEVEVQRTGTDDMGSTPTRSRSRATSAIRGVVRELRPKVVRPPLAQQGSDIPGRPAGSRPQPSRVFKFLGRRPQIPPSPRPRPPMPPTPANSPTQRRTKVEVRATYVHDRYGESVVGGRLSSKSFVLTRKSKLDSRVADHFDPRTKTLYEFNTTPWSKVPQDVLREKVNFKIQQVGKDLQLKRERKIRSAVWYGTEPLPATGEAERLRRALKDAGIEYRVAPLPADLTKFSPR
ncbi:hypothetical protein [Mycobacterium sp. IS-1742]|uniref:hypothetical protein n=1 Tax=Mycobacterium sp. IS-1742 TaxID=1772285 RepID=UPI001E316060|nr:hypothetical protein [Mycobacterium sp. IS-1742]